MKRFILYFRYFFYVAYHWNLRVAFYIIQHEVCGEIQYGIHTTGIDELFYLEDHLTEHATIYMPVLYPVIEEIFALYPPNNFKHFMDIGCGRGRALCVAASLGCKKVTGIDISKELCMDTIHNLQQIQEKYPAIDAKVICQNAATQPIPTDVDCIFLFNPFDAVIMEAVIKQILQSISQQPRPITVIYANAILGKMLLDAGFKEVHYLRKMRYVEVTVYRWEV